jgi:predicted Fe-S protein YdhL (DUF1289 family)
MSIPAFRAVLSPCVGVCALDADGLCQGCLRTADEIAAWPLLDDAQRLRFIEIELPRREARRR